METATAIPLGFIVNELITNAIKYAFAERGDGVITIKAMRPENRVFLVFEDNGCGIPESVTVENSSSGFGLQLVGMLVKQIHGSLTIEKQNGTRFVIEFEAA